MKKLLSVLLALALVLSLASVSLAETQLEKVKAAGKLVIATSPDFAPSEFIDPGKSGQDQYVGCDISLIKYIADYLGVELVIQAMDFSATLGAVSSGAVDVAISGFAPTPERAESYELSMPFLFESDKGQGILVMKDQVDNYKTAADFAGKKIAVQNASLQQKLLGEQLPDAKPELITSINDAVMMLISGKVDAVGVSVDNGESYVNNYAQLAVSEFRYDYKSIGTVIAAKKGETDLVNAINEAITKALSENLLLGWYNDAMALADSLGID